MAPDESSSSWAANSSMSLEEYLGHKLGPQRLNMGLVIPLTVVYGVIFVAGILGNLCTCLVITRNSHMHTATNYYLFNLAVADVLTLLLGVPNDISVYWQQYPYMFGVEVCKTRALVSEMTSNASVLTIVAFTTERYLAICHPFRSHTLSVPSRAVKTIAAVWAVAGVSAVPFAVLTTVHRIDFPQGSGNFSARSAFCSVSMVAEGGRYAPPLFQLSTFVFFVLPLVAISALYIKIGLKLRKLRMSRQISDSSITSERELPSKRVVVNILVAVVVTFFICWAPFHAQRLLVVYVNNNEWNASLRTINETLYYIAGCCYYINCTTNPIFYTVMSKKYRQAFERAIHCYTRSATAQLTWSVMSRDSHVLSATNDRQQQQQQMRFWNGLPKAYARSSEETSLNRARGFSHVNNATTTIFAIATSAALSDVTEQCSQPPLSKQIIPVITEISQLPDVTSNNN